MQDVRPAAEVPGVGVRVEVYGEPREEAYGGEEARGGDVDVAGARGTRRPALSHLRKRTRSSASGRGEAGRGGGATWRCARARVSAALDNDESETVEAEDGGEDDGARGGESQVGDP